MNEMGNIILSWKCPLCDGMVEMQACATVCLGCGVSLNPSTHKPYMDDGKPIKASCFGGGGFP